MARKKSFSSLRVAVGGDDTIIATNPKKRFKMDRFCEIASERWGRTTNPESLMSGSLTEGTAETTPRFYATTFTNGLPQRALDDIITMDLCSMSKPPDDLEAKALGCVGICGQPNYNTRAFSFYKGFIKWVANKTETISEHWVDLAFDMIHSKSSNVYSSPNAGRVSTPGEGKPTMHVGLFPAKCRGPTWNSLGQREHPLLDSAGRRLCDRITAQSVQVDQVRWSCPGVTEYESELAIQFADDT
uniref:RdRp n=1 Tax=viral metagenome TaxID=1070528 RepID=A0A2V0RBC1_9ZZZZ